MTNRDITAVYVNESSAYDYGWSRQAFIDCINSGYECWVVEVPDEDDYPRIVGHGILVHVGDEASIANLCIHPEKQGCGMGRSLLLHLIDRSHERLVNKLFLEVRSSNTIAQNLYFSVGFKKIGIRKDYYRTESGREDADVLALNLYTVPDA